METMAFRKRRVLKRLVFKGKMHWDKRGTETEHIIIRKRLSAGGGFADVLKPSKIVGIHVGKQVAIITNIHSIKNYI